MLALLSLLFLVVPLALVGLVVGVVIAIRRQDAIEEEPVDPGIGTPRRIFLYGLALVGLIFAAVGLSLLLGGALDALFSNTVFAARRRSLSVALAFTVVGTPAWLLFLLLAQRTLTQHPVELRSQTRRLYLVAARGIALSVVAVTGTQALRMVFRVEDFSGGPIGMLVVWAGVWTLHQRYASSEPPPTTLTRLIERLYLYFGAVFGLWMLVGGVMQLLDAPLSAAYDRAFRSGLLMKPMWSEGVRRALPVVIVGSTIWAWHWLRMLLRRDRLTPLWRVYVLLFGALTGLVLTVVPLALLLYTALEWFIGAPRATTAAAHFTNVPAVIATLLVGAAAWAYHRVVLIEAGAARERTGPERVYRYLVATGGLVTAAFGVVTLLALTADALAGTSTDLLRVHGWWRNTLLRSVVLLLVGIPLWGRYWWDAQREAAADPAERGALSRRVYLFNALCIAIVALLISLTIVLYEVFQRVLGSSLSSAFLRDSRWSIGVAVIAGVIAVYHFLVLREDQRALPEAPPQVPVRRREVMLLAPGAPGAIVAALESIEGVHVRAWRRLDTSIEAAVPDPEQLAALRERVSNTDADRLIVLTGPAGFEVVPYTEP